MDTFELLFLSFATEDSDYGCFGECLNDASVVPTTGRLDCGCRPTSNLTLANWTTPRNPGLAFRNMSPESK